MVHKFITAIFVNMVEFNDLRMLFQIVLLKRNHTLVSSLSSSVIFEEFVLL